MSLHCWAAGPWLCTVRGAACPDGGDCGDAVSTTCMRERGHDGPHEWTRDDEISFTLVKEDTR